MWQVKAVTHAASKTMTISDLTSLPLLIASSLSYAAYNLIALFQPATADFTVYKDIGMGGAFIATCVFMFRYFTKQIEQKDADHKDMTDKFIEVIKETSRQNAEIKEQINTLTQRKQELQTALERVEQMAVTKGRKTTSAT